MDEVLKRTALALHAMDLAVDAYQDTPHEWGSRGRRRMLRELAHMRDASMAALEALEALDDQRRGYRADPGGEAVATIADRAAVEARGLPESVDYEALILEENDDA